MSDFSEHTVLVTGAAAGIGFGIALAFHAAGGRVALGDVNTSGLARAAERLGEGEHREPEGPFKRDVQRHPSSSATARAA